MTLQSFNLCRWMLIFGASLALLSVIIGALSAHMLKDILNENAIQLVNTATNYQMYHSLALIFCGILNGLIPISRCRLFFAAFGFLAGICLFCGSLYLIAFTEVKDFGAIAPIGGVAFIFGWLMFIYAIFRVKPPETNQA